MNDNYLWDKSGEPDPEIVELEQELGTLRYQPRPLRIPPAITAPRRTFAPSLALAATIAFVLLAVGIWIGLNLRKTNVETAQTTKPKNISGRDPRDEKPRESPTPNSSASPTEDKKTRTERPDRKNERRQPARLANEAVAQTTNKYQGVRGVPQSALQRQEAELAKEQLLTALRLASNKLNLAQKRAQGTPSVIRNQHKVG
jgi:hypothetical protein